MMIPRKLAIVAVGAVFLGLLVGGCGGISGTAHHRQVANVDWLTPPKPIASLHERSVGDGINGAILLWHGKNAGHKVVVFLHGWLALPPYFYGPWLSHLASEGYRIIYPVYQGRQTRPADLRSHVLSGITAGLQAIHSRPRSVVAIGHMTGGALAFDYAAVARMHGLPQPRAVIGIYPARNPPPGDIPTADLSHIPRGTRLGVVAGPGDPVPGGDAQAHSLLAAASHVRASQKSFLRAPVLESSDHSPSDPMPRRSFWRWADRVIGRAEANGEGK